MAKAPKAKKAPARKSTAKRAASASPARSAPVNSSFNPLSELAKWKADKEAQDKRNEEQRLEILRKGIEVKSAALEKAIASRNEAQKKVDDLEKELRELKVQAGLARPAAGRKPAGKGRPRSTGGKSAAGRKPRVDPAVKQSTVADVLKKFPNGVPFAALKKELGKVKAADGKPMFGAADFNSSATFASKVLPSTHKIQGKHRAAKVVKK